MPRNRMPQKVTLDVRCPGDPSVNIQGGGFTVDLGTWYPGTFFQSFDREEIKKAFIELADDYFGECGPAHAHFNDECGDCGKVGCKGQCCGHDEGDPDAPPQFVLLEVGDEIARFDTVAECKQELQNSWGEGRHLLWKRSKDGKRRLTHEQFDIIAVPRGSPKVKAKKGAKR